MAKPTKLASGNWRGQVRKKGYPSLSATFPTKKEATQWITDTESKLNRGVNVHHEEAAQMSFLAAVERYEAAKLPTAKHPAKLKSQLKVIKQSELVKYSVANVTAKVIRGWRDKRLSSVTNDTVIKDMGKVSAIFAWLESEQDIQLPNGNPARKVIKPSREVSTERNRRTSPEEVQSLLKYFNSKGNRQMVRALMLALMTGMRRGELLNIRIRDINFRDRTLTIPRTKNGYAREIPLYSTAYRLLESVANEAHEHRHPEGQLFTLKPDSVTQAFSRACKALGIEDLRWHDLRHEAVSRMFERGELTMAEIASISGHRSYDMLKRYTHIKAKDLNVKINRRDKAQAETTSV